MNLPLARPSLGRSLRLGALAGTAYLAEMALDMRLTRNRYDDLILWGGFFARSPARQRAIGAIGHYGLSAALAAGYGTTGPLLPRGPAWIRGLLFTMAEHLLTFPTIIPGGRIHPSVRNGDLPSFATWQYFWVETARHAAFGLALGAFSGE